MTKSTKSQQGGLAPSSFRTSCGVHELVARAVRGECVRHRSNVKVGGFIAPHSFSYTTRANISHEIVEQIRARIVCTPAISARRAWGSACADGSRNFCQPSPAGEGVARSVTDEVFLYLYCKKPYFAMFAPSPAPKLEPRGSP